ncbi:hypothetical protein D6U55_16875, partial [Vibrio cholerae]|nr:hypothetical protein [Vibrio cholerae]
LGDWYLLNPNPEQSSENFRVIKLSLASDYHFSIDIQKKDFSVDHWNGAYSADEKTLILGLDSSDPQTYQYENNHHLLTLNGVTFTKGLPNTLAGSWSSAHIKDLDGESLDQSLIQLTLQPDFIFSFHITNQDGNEATHRGVYYTEGNRLVLLYSEGEHDTRYVLDQDRLTLEIDDSMTVVMNRVQ